MGKPMICREELIEWERQQSADNGSHYDRGQVTAENVRHQTQRRRSQCRSNPDLAPALSDREGHERVNTGRRKKKNSD